MSDGLMLRNGLAAGRLADGGGDGGGGTGRVEPVVCDAIRASAALRIVWGVFAACTSEDEDDEITVGGTTTEDDDGGGAKSEDVGSSKSLGEGLWRKYCTIS
jgi:hypothetical protein